MASWSPPNVVVESVRIVSDDEVLVGLRLPADLNAPLAPASLVSAGAVLIHLDRVLGDRNGVTTFRTEELPREPLLGLTVGFQQWWTPDQDAVVRDLTRVWARSPAPEPVHHEHCVMGWETIEQGVGDGFGWRSGRDWVCSDCYHRYFVEDNLDVRGE